MCYWPCCGKGQKPYTTIKYDANGNELFRVDHGNQVDGLAADENGFVTVSRRFAFSTHTIRDGSSSVTEIQVLKPFATSTSGTFTLIWRTVFNITTGSDFPSLNLNAPGVSIPINYNCTAAELHNAIQTAMTNAGYSATFTCTGGPLPGKAIRIRFLDPLNVYPLSMPFSPDDYSLSPSKAIACYDSNGNILWESDCSAVATTRAPISAVVMDADYVYVGGVDFVAKYDRATGQEITTGEWPQTGFGSVQALALDGAGGIYAGSINTHGKTMFKLNEDGEIVWDQTNPTDPNGVTDNGRAAVLLYNGNPWFLAATAADDVGGIVELDANDGSVLTVLDVPAGRDFTSDGTGGFIVVRGLPNGGGTANKYLANGSTVWTSNVAVNAFSVDHSEGNLLFAGRQINPQMVAEAIQTGNSMRNTIMRIFARGKITGGAFICRIGDTVVTDSIPWNATAEEVQEIMIEGFFPDGSVQASGGPLPETPVIVEFVGPLANTNILFNIFPASGGSGVTGEKATHDIRADGTFVRSATGYHGTYYLAGDWLATSGAFVRARFDGTGCFYVAGYRSIQL